MSTFAVDMLAPSVSPADLWLRAALQLAISGSCQTHLRYLLPERLWEFAPSAGTL